MKLGLVVFLIFLSWAGHAQGREGAADLVFTGGAVYTLNADQPWAAAVAIREGRIVFVGDDTGAAPFVGAETRVIALDGRMLLPGFHDSHSHPMAAGTRFLRCQLYDLDWPDEVLAKVAECLAGLDDGQWLRAVGLNPNALEGGTVHRRRLDPVTGARPAVLATHFARSVLVNSAALRAGGIDANTPEPEHGTIERDPDTGEPTGILRDEAFGQIWQLASKYETDEYLEALRRASAIANRFGITTTNEASARPEHWEAYREAEAAGEMTLRVNVSLGWNSVRDADPLSRLETLRGEATGTRVRFASVKLFLDGDIGGSASVLEPYASQRGGLGTSTYGERLGRIIERLDAGGFDVHLHAYGDRAVRDGLDAIEGAIETNPAWDRRPHMAHLALVDPADRPRFAALGVTADVQPLWAQCNDDHAALAALLGPPRSESLIPIRSLFDAGARVVAGSDWISESMNPLVAIQYAVTRRPLDGSGPAWNPDERATLAQMLEAYTINGAWLARQENETGTIEVGKSADLVALERNLFEVDPMALKDVPVLLTLLEGVEVYRAEGWKD